MYKCMYVFLTLLVFMISLVGCGASDRLTTGEKNDLIAGITDDEIVDGSLTILLCGPSAGSIENIVSEYEKKYETDVNVIRYDTDADWSEFATKVLAQDSDFDLFMPVQAQLGSIIRSGVYQDLSGYESIRTRIESNSLTSMISMTEGELIGVPCCVELMSSKDSMAAMTLFKYCYKNLNLFTGSYSDPDGEELFEVLKNRYANPDDGKENAFYDFEYNSASTSYLFMNNSSLKKDLAADFLCYLFDVLNEETEVEQTIALPYPSIEADAEYTPSWLFYSYEFVEPLGEAFTSVADTDGSDDALRRLAREAANGVGMRLEG